MRIQAIQLTVAQRRTLVEARQARGWLPGRLAERLEVSRPMIVQIERGQKPVSVDLLERWARALRLDLSIDVAIELKPRAARRRRA